MAVPELAVNRLKRDYMELIREPIDNIWAHPLDDNILEWHYAFKGPADTPFANGIYHGKLLFPKDYPLSGPSIYMLTPNGRFILDTKICVAGISDLHPERWCPAHSVSTVLVSLLSFMTEENTTDHFVGMANGNDPIRIMMGRAGMLSKEQLTVQRKELAKKSLAFNLNDQIFCKYFPQLVEESKRRNAQNI